MLTGADEWFSGAIGARQYAARGHIAAEAAITPTQSIQLQLSIDDGWLVPAHDASKSGVAAIDVSLDDDSPWQLVSIRYPEPQFAEFSKESVPVYRGEVELTAQLEHRGDITNPPSIRIIPLTVHLQSCRDDKCLEPEYLRLELSL
jgi:DsbC/DsbD-like thiol-disulfide interchange protein